MSVATILMYYANSITNLGLNQALVQKDRIASIHVNSVFSVDLAVSFFMAIFFIIFSKDIAGFFNSPKSDLVIKIMSLTFLLTTFYELPSALLRREMNFKVTSIVDTCRESMIFIITLILAYSGFGYWAIVWGTIIPLFLGSVCLCMVTRWAPKLQFQLSAIRELYDFGLWSFLRGQLYFFGGRLDRLLAGKFFGPSVLGVYDKAKSFAQLPNENVTWQLNIVFFLHSPDYRIA